MRLVAPLALGLAAALALVPTTQAAQPSYMADPIYNSPLFNFEGFYAGLQAGGAALPGPGIVGVVGVVAGENFAINDSFVTGIEFQGEGLFNSSGYIGLDALLLGRVGGYVTDQLMAYGAAGFGVVNGGGAYAFGGGLEMPLMDQVSARGELLGTGAFGASPSGAKLTAGLLWHMSQ